MGSILLINHLFAEPIILYTDSISPLETKLKVRLFGKRNIIHFGKIKRIENVEIDLNWIYFVIVLKNGSKHYLNVDTFKDFKLIIDTFDKYKNK
jgi:hypothetical protein